MTTSIEWTMQPGTKGETWNPIRARHRETGKLGWFCIHASAGCSKCYAEKMNAWRGNGASYTAPALKAVEVFLDEEVLEAPLHWKAPRTIFVCSMTDLFGEWVEGNWIDRVFVIAALCPQHTFIVLTKRADRMRAYMAQPRNLIDRATNTTLPWPLPNVRLGVSVEDQPNADARVPDLLATLAAVRFLSVEPLLGPVMLGGAGPTWLYHREMCGLRLYGPPAACLCNPRPIDWIIVGGESGPGARPFALEWLDAIVAQAAAAGVPCFVKQLGRWPVVRSARSLDTFTTWVNKAQTRLDPGDVCIDARGRVLRIGADFQRARDEGAFPVAIHQPLELKDKKGGDPAEWPKAYPREFPAAVAA